MATALSTSVNVVPQVAGLKVMEENDIIADTLDKKSGRASNMN
jgi:hypothetical protein